NDPCPCGSGKKYKKCCLAKDREESAAASPGSEPELVLNPPRTSLWPTAPAQVEHDPEPSPPPDPITQRAEIRWKEFESSTEEGRIALFLETLEDTELMTDDMAFEMLSRIHQDALNRGDRGRIPALVGALRERLPEVFDKSASYYLTWCLQDA